MQRWEARGGREGGKEQGMEVERGEGGEGEEREEGGVEVERGEGWKWKEEGKEKGGVK